MSSLRNKLSRLSPLRTGGAAAALPPPAASGSPRDAATSDGGAAPCDPADSSPKAAKLAELRERMQAVLSRTARRAPPPPPPVDTVDLPFKTTETALGPLHLRTHRLSPAHRTGSAPLLPARTASPELLALLALDPALAGCEPAGALYLDTETTGLSGGTGTVAFLVGLAFWENGELVTEQVLVRALGEEAPMLTHVAERIRAASMLVTFNGKSFDLPLLRTRFVMARVPAPTEPPHLDLLHIARRLHKPRGVECRLVGLERDILGFERHDDVPSGEVSACYLHFLRTGDARPLLGVVEHNLWDVVTMASLVGLYGEPLEGSQLHAADLVGLARTLRRAGDMHGAQRAADAAVARGVGPESLRVRAEVSKARGDRAAALADLEALLAEATPLGESSRAGVCLELAKLYEHFVKEPARALQVLAEGTTEPPAQASKRSRRLARKVERARQATLPLAAPIKSTR